MDTKHITPMDALGDAAVAAPTDAAGTPTDAAPTPPAPAVPTNEELLDAFMTTRHLLDIAHHQRIAKEGPGGDPTRGIGRALSLLKLKDNISTREMAEVLGIRVSSLNETIARMEAEGLVVRTPSPSDGRVMLIALTEKGREKELPNHAMPDVIFDDFSDDERTSLSAGLNHMARSLEAELGEDAAQVLRRGREKRARIFAGEHGGPEVPGPFGPDGPHERGPHGGSDGQHGGPEGPHGGPDGPHGHGPHGDGPHGHGPHGHGKTRGNGGPRMRRTTREHDGLEGSRGHGPHGHSGGHGYGRHGRH